MSGGKFWSRNSAAAKLDASQVYELRARYATGRVTQGQLSRDYGISVVQVGRIVRGEVWQKLDAPPPTAEQITASAERLMEVQRATLRERMAEDIKAEQEREKRSDTLLEELNNLKRKPE